MNINLVMNTKGIVSSLLMKEQTASTITGKPKKTCLAKSHYKWPKETSSRLLLHLSQDEKTNFEVE